jgi:predicted protein tyrosine phosphatase
MRVLSASKVRAYVPGPCEVLIAIRSRGAKASPLQAGWADVLSIECDDTGEFAPPRQDSRPLTVTEASAILDFVEHHRHQRRLVIHCDAGVSRSRSVAAAVAEHLGLPYSWTVFNADVVATVRAAAALRLTEPISRTNRNGDSL